MMGGWGWGGSREVLSHLPKGPLKLRGILGGAGAHEIFKQNFAVSSTFPLSYQLHILLVLKGNGDGGFEFLSVRCIFVFVKVSP